MNRIETWLRTHWWVLLLLAVTLLGTLLRGGGERPAPGPLAGVLAGVAVLALLVRTWRPEVTLLVNAAAVTAYFALTYPDGPIYLSIFCSAYAISARRPFARWWPYALVGGLPVFAAIVAHRVSADDASIQSVALPTAWSVAVYVAALAIGSAIRNRSETRHEQARRTATEERLRMAQDLHDGVGHGLAVIAMQAGVALHVLDKPDGDRTKVRESLLAIRDTSRESLDALRVELSRLAGAAPVALAPAADLAELPALLDRVRAGGLHVSLNDHHGPVPDEVSRVAYLVVQEALTNVLRHAGASTAEVRLVHEGGALVVTVRDDGRAGRSSTGEPVTEGLGLGGMRDRTAQLGGTLAAGRGPQGFVVRAVLPVDASMVP